MSVLLVLLLGVRPEVMVQVGAGSQVRHAALSPNNKLAVTAAHDTSVKLWDVERRAIVKLIPVGMVPQSAQFLPDGQHILVEPFGSTLVIDLVSGKVVGSGPGADNSGVQIAPDGKHAAIVNRQTASIVSLPELKPAFSVPTSTGVAFSPDGKELATFDGSALAFYDVRSGKRTATVNTTIDSPLKPYYAPGAIMVVLANGYATFGYSRDGRELWRGPKSLLASSPDGKSFVACVDNYLVPFDPGTGKTGRRIAWHECSWKVSVSGDGQRVIHAVFGDAGVRIDTIATDTPPVKLLSEGTFASAARASPNGRVIATGHEDGTVRVWNAATAQQEESAMGVSGKITSALAFSPDGQRLFSGHGGGTVIAWDLHPMREAFRVTLEGEKISALTAGKDAAYAGTQLANNAAALYAIEAGKPPHEILRHTEGISELSVSSDGHVLYLRDLKHLSAVKTDGTKRWSVAAWGSSVSTSDDGKTLVISERANDYAKVHFVDAASGKINRTCEPGKLSNLGYILEHVDGARFFASDKKLLLSVSAPFVALVVDVQSCKVEKQLKGHRTALTAFDAAGSRVITASRNEATVRIWDIEKESEIVQLLAIDNGGYVSITPDGYYVSSKDATNAITFTLGLRAYSYDLFDLRLNRPDIVAERLALADKTTIDMFRAAVQKRIKRAGFTTFGDDFSVPDIVVSDADGGVQVRATDHTALDRLIVTVNGVPLSARGISLGRAKSALKHVSLPLGQGRNLMTVSALNSAGVESERVMVERVGPPEQKGKLFVVALGVSKYQQSAYDLDYAAKDARDVAAFLSTEKDKFADVDVQVLTDADVTREHVQALKGKLAQTSVDDTVVLFIAGHGLLDAKLDYYFATHDVAFEKPADRGLAWTDLEALFDGIPARKRLLLVDACHSGEVDKDELSGGPAATSTDARGGSVKARGLKRTTKASAGSGSKPLSVLMQELFVDLRHGSGANVLSSATGAQYAYESKEWSNGVFTFALLEALKLRAADLDKNQNVSLDELRAYVPARVGALTNGRQTPTARSLNKFVDIGL